MAFTQTRDDLIKAVLRNLGSLEIGETPEPDEVTHVSDKLNKLIDYLDEAFGVRLWKLEWRQRVFNSPDEVVGADSENYFCILNHTTPNTTTRVDSTAYAVGALVKPATENGFYYECTVAGTSDSSEPTMPTRQDETVTDGTVTWKTVPDTKPGIGKNASTYWSLGGTSGVTYTQNAAKESGAEFALLSDELEVQKAFIRYGGLDDEVDLIDAQKFYLIGDKVYQNQPTALYLDHNRSKVFLYPLPDLTDYVLHYQAVTALNDMDESGDTFDFPNKWLRPLEYLLTADVAPSMGIDSERVLYFERKGAALLDRIIKTDKPKVTRRFISSAF